MAGTETRNIVLLGHGGAGKTTLAEAMLFAAGGLSRQGTVGDGNTVSDFRDDEKERGNSIDTSLLHADWKGKRFHILDAPGYPDFLGKPVRAVDAADCAVIVINAYDRVALNARRLYLRAGERGLPRILVVNRCDLDNIDEEALAESLTELSGSTAKAVTMPDAFGPGCAGVKSVFGAATELKEGFVEAAVEADDELMEKYLEAGEVSDDDLRRAIPLALQAGTLVPVFHTCAEKGIGVTELMDFLAEFGPAAAGRTVPDTDGNAVACAADGPTLAYCYDVTFDRQAGKIAFLRVYRGGLRAGDMIENARSGNTVKVGHLALYQGGAKEDLAEAGVGSFAALTKVDDIEIGDTLHAPGSPVQLAQTRTPKPMVGLALTTKARGDDAKIGKELARITGADPCLISERSEATHELVLKGLSTLHLDVALKRLAKAGIEVDTATPAIPYLETITGKAEASYRHKKQSGGSGQFGEIFLRIEPTERGSAEALEMVDESVGGAVPKQFYAATEKGVRQQMEEGVIAGCRVVDVRVTVYDGKTHDVDSKEIAFIIAGRKAFALAFEKAKPALLEPVVDVEILIPSRFMGDISSDLNARRARIQGMETVGNVQIIKAQAPLSEMQTYSTQLRSITAGEGSFTMEFSHYDVVPANVTQQIVARRKKAAEES